MINKDKKIMLLKKRLAKDTLKKRLLIEKKARLQNQKDQANASKLAAVTTANQPQTKYGWFSHETVFDKDKKI